MYETLMEIMKPGIKQREDAKTIKTIRRKGNPHDSDKTEVHNKFAQGYAGPGFATKWYSGYQYDFVGYRIIG